MVESNYIISEEMNRVISVLLFWYFGTAKIQHGVDICKELLIILFFG